MSERLKSLQTRYRETVTDADEIRKAYEGTAETMSAEDEQRYDALMVDADSIWVDIEREEKRANHRAYLDDAGDIVHPASSTVTAVATVDETKSMEAFTKFLKHGPAALSYDEVQSVVKAHQADSDIEGGYLVAPEVFVNQLLKDVDDAVHVRQLASVFQLERAESLGVPTLDRDLDDAEWTGELTPTTNDEGLRFGKRELHPHPLSKETRLSRPLIRKAHIGVEALVRARLGYAFAITAEKAYLVGTGDRQPLGVFTPSESGISEARDVLSGKANDMSADGLIDIVHALKPHYWGSARWFISREFLKRVRKLKDGNGQYLWQAGIQSNLPASILEIPYIVSEYTPNDFTDGEYVAVLGDFSYYWIVDALDFSIQVLKELYSRTNQIGYIGRMESDGMPVLEEAFIRVKVGA